MITLLVGENSFEVEQKLQQLVAESDGVPEKFDGSELELRQLPDLLMGVSLFAEKRLIIIRGLGANKQTWEALPEWLERMSDDIHLVLVEAKPDKRTKSWKALQKAADTYEFKSWTERDHHAAEAWVSMQASQRNISLTSDVARLLVARIGVDQWQLSQALEKLSVFDEITEALVTEHIEASPHENVFMVFETALKGDVSRVQEMVKTLRLGKDPYQLFGLLAGQAFQLAALATASENDDVARDIGAHPFVLSKLRAYATARGVAGARNIVEAFATADDTMKTSAVDPWLVIEQTLLRVAEK